MKKGQRQDVDWENEQQAIKETLTDEETQLNFD